MAKKANLLELVRRFIEDNNRRKEEFTKQFGEAYSAHEEKLSESPVERAARAALAFKYGAQIRDLFIRIYTHNDSNISDKDILENLDRDLDWGETTIGVPPRWMKEGIRTFMEAYNHSNRRFRARIHVIIAKARKDPIRIAGLQIILSESL